MLRRWKQWSADHKGEKGSVIVESCIVFPVMFIVLAFIIFFGNVYYQMAQVDDCVQRAAIKGAQCIINPQQYDTVEKGMIPLSINDVAPYRYIFGEIPGASIDEIERKIGQDLQNEIEQKTSTYFIDMNPTLFGNNKKIAEFNNYVFYSDFRTQVEYEVRIPVSFSFMETPNLFRMKSRAVVPVNDTPEFIRNVDLVVDVFWNLKENKAIKSITDQFTKVKNFIDTFAGNNGSGDGSGGGTSSGGSGPQSGESGSGGGTPIPDSSAKPEKTAIPTLTPAPTPTLSPTPVPTPVPEDLESKLSNAGISSQEDISRANRLKAAGVSDEDIIDIIKNNKQVPRNIQKKILKEDPEFAYLKDDIVSILSIIDKGYDITQWKGKLSGKLKMTDGEWSAVDKYLREGHDVYRIPEEADKKTSDFTVDGKQIEYKQIISGGEYAQLLGQAKKYAKTAFPDGDNDGKHADVLVLDWTAPTVKLTVEDAKNMADEIKKLYPNNKIEIWTKNGEVIR